MFEGAEMATLIETNVVMLVFLKTLKLQITINAGCNNKPTKLKKTEEAIAKSLSINRDFVAASN